MLILNTVIYNIIVKITDKKVVTVHRNTVTQKCYAITLNRNTVTKETNNNYIMEQKQGQYKPQPSQQFPGLLYSYLILKLKFTQKLIPPISLHRI
jgi:hypothetical protein